MTGRTEVVPRSLTILLFPDVEVLDFAGPLQVFSTASRFTAPPAFRITTAAERAGPLKTFNGLKVLPDATLEVCPTPDLLLVPGGVGTRRELGNERLLGWIRETSETCEMVLSVCTGALLLGKAGLLDELEATTFHQTFDLLREVAPKADLVRDRRYVDNGRILLSSGVSAGIDLGLHVVGRILGPEIAARTARHMEWPGSGEPGGRGLEARGAVGSDTEHL